MTDTTPEPGRQIVCPLGCKGQEVYEPCPTCLTPGYSHWGLHGYMAKSAKVFRAVPLLTDDHEVCDRQLVEATTALRQENERLRAALSGSVLRSDVPWKIGLIVSSVPEPTKP